MILLSSLSMFSSREISFRRVLPRNFPEETRNDQRKIVQSLVYLETTWTIIFIDDISQNHVLWNSSRHYFDTKARFYFDSSQTRYPPSRSLSYSCCVSFPFVEFSFVFSFSLSSLSFLFHILSLIRNFLFSIFFFFLFSLLIRSQDLRPIFLDIHICIVSGKNHIHTSAFE